MSNIEESLRQTCLELKAEVKMLQRQTELLSNALGVCRLGMQQVVDEFAKHANVKRSKAVTKIIADLKATMMQADVLEGDAALESLSEDEKPAS